MDRHAMSAETAVCQACGWEGASSDTRDDICPACGQDTLCHFTPASDQVAPQPRRRPGRPREADVRIAVGFPRDLLDELTAAAAAAGHSREREIRNRCGALGTDTRPSRNQPDADIFAALGIPDDSALVIDRTDPYGFLLLDGDTIRGQVALVADPLGSTARRWRLACVTCLAAIDPTTGGRCDSCN